MDLDQRRATGVQFYLGTSLQRVRARREVIVSAGAFGPPQLQLSGIGAPAALQQAGVTPVHAPPGVGQNLQDHIDYVQSWTAPSHTASFGASLRGIGSQIARAVFEWAAPAQRAWSPAPLLRPVPSSAGARKWRCAGPAAGVCGGVGGRPRSQGPPGHGISCHVDVLRPYSRGTVGIRSSNPRGAGH